MMIEFFWGYELSPDATEPIPNIYGEGQIYNTDDMHRFPFEPIIFVWER